MSELWNLLQHVDLLVFSTWRPKTEMVAFLRCIHFVHRKKQRMNLCANVGLYHRFCLSLKVQWSSPLRRYKCEAHYAVVRLSWSFTGFVSILHLLQIEFCALCRRRHDHYKYSDFKCQSRNKVVYLSGRKSFQIYSDARYTMTDQHTLHNIYNVAKAEKKVLGQIQKEATTSFAQCDLEPNSVEARDHGTMGWRYKLTQPRNRDRGCLWKRLKGVSTPHPNRCSFQNE